MRRAARAACCWLGLATALHAQPAREADATPRLPENNPYTSAADLEAGRRLYTGRCGHCHGKDGEGGRGTALNTGRFRHGASDRELFLVIRSGIPNTEMPGVNIPESDVWRIVAHVQALGRQGALDRATGDAAAGVLVYRASGCAACHSIHGEGGFLGTDLTDVGTRRAVWHLRESLVKPDADIALDYRTVVVTTAAGREISGIHLNEDEYSVHLRDTAGELRAFLKAELRRVELPRKSLMPAYTSLAQAELENLVAYLSSLQSNQKPPPEAVVWTLDRLENVGGHRTTVLGEPKLIDSPAGKAVEFDGVDDALVVDDHPLAGAREFTLEAVFRPDGGQREQRWLHLCERDPKTGEDTDNRMLFEIRVIGDQWYLDSYHQSGSVGKALMNRSALHPVGAWYHVATVYDGRELRNHVDGVQEGAFTLDLAPHGPGRTSIGVRINKVSWFKGAVRLARFTRRALQPAEFLEPPPKP
jgi:putative heme-binding domain-containing protein